MKKFTTRMYGPVTVLAYAWKCVRQPNLTLHCSFGNSWTEDRQTDRQTSHNSVSVLADTWAHNV